MRRLLRRLGTLGLGLLGCVSEDGAPQVNPRDVGMPMDASSGIPMDASAPCDQTQPFGPAQVLAELPWEVGTRSTNATLTADEKTIYFIYAPPSRDGGPVDIDIFTASRTDRSMPFGPQKRVESVSAHPVLERHVSVTGDGRTLYFTRQDAVGAQTRLYVASSNGGEFGNVSLIALPNAPPIGRSFIDDYTPSVRSDGSLLYFGSIGRSSASADIFKVTVPYALAAMPTPVAELNVPDAQDYQPVLSANELDIYFASNRGAGSGMDVWHASRKGPGDNFSVPERDPSLSSEFLDFPTWLSPDGCNMYLTRSLELDNTKDGSGYRLYVARKPR